jgi:ABC-type transport system involved in multi-copper enzyme maturation permease subunit
VIAIAIVAPWVLGFFWPKGAAIAYAAFREGIRQPMFLLLMGGALTALLVSLVLPYFTFGEDYKMMYELGFDIITFASLVFACIAASMFISEEIEGRTAVTLLSKPVSRFDFLVGKFAGILMAAFLMLLQPVSAGGPSSTVAITKVHSVEIQAAKIVIVGDIVCQTWIASEA